MPVSIGNPKVSWRDCRHQGELAQYLERVETAATRRVASLNPRLWISREGVRNGGNEWFWGPAFSPGPDVHSKSISSSFEGLVQSWIAEDLSNDAVVSRLLDGWSILHDAHNRDAALRLLFALSCEDERPADFFDRKLSRHVDGGVRAVGIGLLALHGHKDWAQRRLARLTHDIDDRVFLRTFRAIGALRLTSALPDLFHIVVGVSTLVAMGRRGMSANPVGFGAAHVLLAVLQVTGTDDPDKLREWEGAVPPSAALGSELYESWFRVRDDRPALVGPRPPPAKKLEVPWVAIPAGTVSLGIERWEVHPGWFQHTNIPRREVSLRPFLIGKDPITNAVYDEWVNEFLREGGRPYEHPAQPEGKDHTRVTFGDPRFGPDHPVCGVDWFDAFAFCSYYGLRLPTEDEWEWAATGPRPVPLGRVHGFEQVYGPYPGMLEWSRVLNESSATWPRTTTAPVDDSSISGFGLRHAIGNAWEYTDTNWYTKQSVAATLPATRLTPEQYMSLHPYHVVIKGGAWTSVGDLLQAKYRGPDLFSDRHCEIGFRVVTEPYTLSY